MFAFPNRYFYTENSEIRIYNYIFLMPTVWLFSELCYFEWLSRGSLLICTHFPILVIVLKYLPPISWNDYEGWHCVTWAFDASPMRFISSAHESFVLNLAELSCRKPISFPEAAILLVSDRDRGPVARSAGQSNVCTALGRVQYYTKTAQDYRSMTYCSR